MLSVNRHLRVVCMWTQCDFYALCDQAKLKPLVKTAVPYYKVLSQGELSRSVTYAMFDFMHHSLRCVATGIKVLPCIQVCLLCLCATY